MTPDAVQPRYDHFQIMRGVACLMVVLNHTGGYLSLQIPNFDTRWWAPLICPTGFQWVWLFLALSGFLLTKAFVTGRFSLSAEGIKAFYRNRARRLLPLLWFLTIAWWLLYTAGVWSNALPAFQPRRELGIALALPWLPYFHSTQAIASVDSPVWSAVIELHFCLIMPLLLMAVRCSLSGLLGILTIWVGGVATVAVLAAVGKAPVIFPMIYGQHLYNFGFFALGMALATSPRRTILRAIPWPVVLIVTAAAMEGVQFAAYNALNETLAIGPLVVCPALVLLIGRANDHYQVPLPGSMRAMWGGRSLLRWLEKIGIVSYSVYLFHKPAVYILIEHLGLKKLVIGYLSYGAATALVVVIVLPMAALLFIGIENQFRIRGHRSISVRQAI